MNEQPKSIWKKSIRLPQLLLVWLGLMVATVLIVVGIMMVAHQPAIESHGVVGVLIFGAVGATVLLAGWIFVRWLFCRRNRKRSLFALACFTTLIALFYAEEDWRGWHTWHQFQQSWAAKGEHFDLASSVPPPVPDAQNFAMTPIVFTSYGYILTRDAKLIPYDKRDPHFVIRMHLPIAHNDSPPPGCAGDRVQGTFIKLDGWQGYYREQAAKTNEFAVPSQPQSPAQDVLLALSKYDPVLDELRAASRLPDSRFPINYDSESPWAILLPHLAQLKSCAMLLQLRSAAELQNGQSGQALDDVRLMLQLADKVRTEPILISHLVRAVMVQLALQSVWEGLAQHKWSDAQLIALEAELARPDFVAAYRLGLHGELGGQTGEMDLIRRKPEHLQDLADFWDFDGNTMHYSLPTGMASLIPTGWLYQNEYRSVRRLLEDYLPLADAVQGTFSPSLARRVDGEVMRETESAGLFNWYERIMLPSLGHSAMKFAYAQASVDLARTAIALERYRLAHGDYPEALDALTPQFIAQVPHDVIGGLPLKYRRTSDGQFVLYSVGWNETDDGGVVAGRKSNDPKDESSHTPGISQGDWVWRYPAK